MYPQVFGKYVLERELSRGGMARVLLATLRGAGGFEKRLVVKQIRDELAFDQQFVRRFVEEAKTTVALSHPNIVPVYELGVEQGTYFLAMELVEGVSIAELIAERPLTPEEGAYVGIEVCRALDYAHRRMKVVHRDITPRNVMVDEEGQIKLIDFGIAAPALVAGHEILGSPGHMAPEQLDGGELGPPTDIFAVATLLVEAWTGSAPFRRATPEESAAAVRGRRPRVADANPRLIPIDEAITRALAIDPAARQQEASELARSLRAFVQGIDVADIARELGERVRALRASVASDAGRPDPEPTPTTNAGGTQTFATREEWSGPPPSTRKIESDSAPPPKAPTDTLATRPIATPIEATPVKARPRRNRAVIAAGAAVVLAVFAWRATSVRMARPAPPAVATATATASVVVAPPASTSAPLVVIAPPTESAAPRVVASAAADAAAKASVALLGEPGTRVAVDGVARGACPTRLALEPGRHDVRFTFDPTSETRAESVTVKSGERVTVRAEFTGVTPTVRVQRSRPSTNSD